MYFLLLMKWISRLRTLYFCGAIRLAILSRISDIHDFKAETDAKHLKNMLDAILAKRNLWRERVTALKNRFRALKAQAAENAPKLYFAAFIRDRRLLILRDVCDFEEWMFSSEDVNL